MIIISGMAAFMSVSLLVTEWLGLRGVLRCVEVCCDARTSWKCQLGVNPRLLVRRELNTFISQEYCM
jgi:hypothetical protein